MTHTDTAMDADPRYGVHSESMTRLVQATRELMHAVGVTDLPDQDLDRVTARINELAEVLGGERRDRVRWLPFGAVADSVRDPDGGAFTLNRFNPWGIPLQLRYHEDGTATGTFHANGLYEGPRDCLHGGVSAYLMDCLLGSLVQAQRLRAFTGTLDLRFVRPTPLDAPLDLEARIAERSGRKLTVVGTIAHDGRTTVEATGLFIEAPPR